MEPEFAPVITPKEILYHLPELVSGREPVLDNPLARRLMLANPECEEALLAVASVESAYSGQGHRISTSTGLSPGRLRKVQSATQKHFGQQLCDLLRESANILIAEMASRTGGWAERTSRHSESWHQSRIDRLIPRFVADSSNRNSEVRRALASRSAHRLLRAAELTSPGNPWVKYSTIASTFCAERKLDVRQIGELARSSTDSELTSSALGLWGRWLIDQDRPKHALDLLNHATATSNRFVSNQLNALLAAALVGNRRCVSKYLDDLLTSTDSEFVVTNLLRELVLGSDQWKSACVRYPNLLTEIGSAISSVGIELDAARERST